MTLLTGPTAAYQVATHVLEDVTAALANGSTSPPTRAGIVPGTIAWDNCETCGQLAVSMSRIYLSDDFPGDAGNLSQNPQQAAWLVAEFACQLIRCAPVGDSQGNPPTMSQLDESAQTVMADCSTILAAVLLSLCTMAAGDLIVDYAMRSAQIQGPAGACVGSEVSFAVSLRR